MTPSTPFRRLFRGVLPLAVGLVATSTQAGDVLVAVAANFAAPMARIAQGFEAATGHTVKLSAGATGKLHAQISHGAPFDVLFSADDETPRRLITEGHAVPGSANTYAIGQLVLWSAKPGFVDDQGRVLDTGTFLHLAIANAKTAPYGAAAHQVLQARGLAAKVRPKIVTAENIGQAYQFVVTGNAELGFVALSQVAQPGKEIPGSVWRVPASLHDELRQDVVLLKAGAHNPAARALIEHVKGDAVRALIASYGYRTPGKP